MTTTAEHTDLDRIRFFIDGEWVDPRGSDTHRALEAATGEPLGTAALVISAPGRSYPDCAVAEPAVSTFAAATTTAAVMPRMSALMRCLPRFI